MLYVNYTQNNFKNRYVSLLILIRPDQYVLSMWFYHLSLAGHLALRVSLSVCFPLFCIPQSHQLASCTEFLAGPSNLDYMEVVSLGPDDLKTYMLTTHCEL